MSILVSGFSRPACSADGVGARRCDGVVDHARRLAELGREARRNDLDLLDHHLGRLEHAQAGPVLLRGVAPVHLVVGPHLRAVRVHPGRAELLVLEPGHVGLQQREVVGVSLHQRQVADLDLADGPAQVDPARLGDRRLAGDRDGLLERADLHRRVDDGGLTGAQRDARPLEGPEAGQLEDDLIGAEGQQRRAERPARAGDEHPLRTRVSVGDRDRDAGQHRPARVLHDPFDGAVDGL